MIEMSDLAAEIIENASSSVRYVRVESWLNGVLLVDDIPVSDAQEEQDQTLRNPSRLTFSVPIEDNGTSWVPSDYDSPLGTYGQRVRVSLGVGVDNDQVEWLNRGWFLINSASTEGSTIKVECLGLLALVEEASFPNEYQPKSGATLASICRALVEPGLTINDDSSPADRSAPTTITYSDNRLDSFFAVIDAWPAVASVTEDGFVSITSPPADPSTGDVVLSLTDGSSGTLIEATASVSRDGAFNAVVAKGQYPDTDPTRPGQEIIVTVQDTDINSPFRYGGPFSPYLVPYGYASPLMTTPAQVRAAAQSILNRKRREAARSVQITAVPHPGIQLGDVVSVTSSRLGLSNALGTITAFTLPYLPDGGAMALTVALED